MSESILKEIINEKKLELNNMIQVFGTLTNDMVVQKSQELDVLINQYLKA